MGMLLCGSNKVAGLSGKNYGVGGGSGMGSVALLMCTVVGFVFVIVCCICFECFFFFFFFQAEDGIRDFDCDWSSDVCSSDLSFLRGTAAAGGIALVNSVGNVGGFIGPILVGWIRDSTGQFAPGLLTLAGILVVGAARSEERRVGKECRSRWSPNHEKKKTR